MTDDVAPDVDYHVLLVGIDAYDNGVSQLYGCVSDIDSIQRLLLERAKIPTSQITRLVSPHPTPERDTAVPARPATLANIRSELTRLGSEAVAPNDRVLVYYAGHGARPEVRRAGTSAFRGEFSERHEALVPVDGDLQGNNVLFDVEFNGLLAGIASRTSSVTVVLDCCHSSGATRSLDGPAGNTRFVDIGPVEISDDQARLFTAGETAEPGSSVDDCQVVAACQSHEFAYEVPKDIPPGETRSGLLTHSLTAALQEIPDDDITTVTWGRLWNEVRSNVETEPEAKGQQHPWMSSGLAREWLGGPPNDGDVGFGITRNADAANEYRIRAGTVAGITPGAFLAVYDAKPHKFPRLGSDDDLDARFTDVLLEVTEANVSGATARAVGQPFDLPAGVRGRLVKPGEAERLPCAVLPPEPAIVDALVESDMLEVTDDARALARLERRDDGWVLTDDVHGVRPDDPVLAQVSDGDVAAIARHLMEQYVRYSGPIRMARRCPDMRGALEVALLACPTAAVQPSELAGLQQCPTGTDGSYTLHKGAMFCIRVRNTSGERLKVSLFHSDSSGPVTLLGDQIIDAKATEYFWFLSKIGGPFQAVLPDGVAVGIDRIVAIGTTDVASDLKHLEDSGTFLASSTRGLAGASVEPPVPPVDQWTATEVIVRTTDP